jgi:hypothetical protein
MLAVSVTLVVGSFVAVAFGLWFLIDNDVRKHDKGSR